MVGTADITMVGIIIMGTNIRAWTPVNVWSAAISRKPRSAKPRQRNRNSQGASRRSKARDRRRVRAVPGGQTPPAVAQRAVLFEEDPNDQQGRRYIGSAIWRTETVSQRPGLTPELAVRADVEIPERRMTVTWSLRRNTDKALPASHTIEFTFNLPADFPGGGIANVPRILMKQDEQARGTPLAGLAVKVTNGFFLIGLSAVDTDVQRNVQLLKDRSWFDIPIVYTNGGRAILAMEKGRPGRPRLRRGLCRLGKGVDHPKKRCLVVCRLRDASAAMAKSARGRTASWAWPRRGPWEPDGVNIVAQLESIANRAEFVFRKMPTATCAGRFLRRPVTLVSPGPTSGSLAFPFCPPSCRDLCPVLSSPSVRRSIAWRRACALRGASRKRQTVDELSDNVQFRSYWAGWYLRGSL